MKLFKGVMTVFVMLFISGCGDQFWCGENGCGADREASSSIGSITIQSRG